MYINRIVKLNLESRTQKLRANGVSFDRIAAILSEESGQPITKHSISRYFLARDKVKAQVVEKSEKLKVKVVEADISTIEKRTKIVDFLLRIALDSFNNDNPKISIMALRAATDAQDSLDTRLGKLSPKGPTFALQNNNFNVNNVKELSDQELLEIIKND